METEMGKVRKYGHYKGLSERASRILAFANFSREDVIHYFNHNGGIPVLKIRTCGKKTFEEIAQWVGVDYRNNKTTQCQKNDCKYCYKIQEVDDGRLFWEK